MKIAVCGNWILWMDMIKREIKWYMELQNVKCIVEGYYDLLKLIKSGILYDLVYLEEPDKSDNEFELLLKKLKKTSNAKIVLISNKAGELNDYSKLTFYRYVYKDLGKNIILSLNDFLCDYENERNSIIFKECEKNIDIQIKNYQILMIESVKRGSYVYTRDKVFRCKNTINYWIEKLQFNNYFQCHRRYIINLDYVKVISGNLISIGNYKAEVSSRLKKVFEQKYYNYSVK